MNEDQALTGTEGQADGSDAAELIERAFHYRGDVTIRTDDGGSVTGYLFNRNARASEPFAQMFETRSGREVSIPYRNVTHVLFTGRDAATASLKRFTDLQDRREAPAQASRPSHRTGGGLHGD